MDRTVYYNWNAETCSTLSEDSAQRTPPILTYRSSRERNSVNVVSSRTSRTGFTQRKSTDSFHIKNVPNRSQPNLPTPPAAQHNNPKKGGGGSLTRKVLHSGISRVAIPCNKEREELDRYYGHVLVLHLQCRNIATMTPGALDPFYNLKNLYLYKNNVRRIEGLERLVNLELLDLSRNNVERIDNLENCKSLKKVYLGFNEIQVVEGLEGLMALEELHLDDQDIPPGQPIIFSPGIMASVAATILVLDLSSNQLPNLLQIASLPVLDTLLAADNQFADLDETLTVLRTLRQLRILNLKGNPIASRPDYKCKVIGIVYRLEILDGKDINDTTRACLQKLRIMKEYRARQKEEAELLKRTQNAEGGTENLILFQADSQGATIPGEFNFSTPTRLSPSLHLQHRPKNIPPVEHSQHKFPIAPLPCAKSSSTPTPSDTEESRPNTSNEGATLQQTPQFALPDAVIDSTSYESRARNLPTLSYDSTIHMDLGGGGDQMSDMAKIIFRLSNLDNSTDTDKDVARAPMAYSSYWDPPGSSMTRECRPLSPLEGVDMIVPNYSASAPELGSKSLEETSRSLKPSGMSGRPKPATIGGRRSSNVNDTPKTSQSLELTVTNAAAENLYTPYYYGRTLSPLMEMPTPDSATARDDN